MLKLLFIYIVHIIPHENLKGFNCLLYEELNKICLASNELGKTKGKQFYEANKYNKILIHIVPQNSSKNKKFVKKYFQNLLKSYLDIVPENIRLDNYSINDYKYKKQEFHPLSIIQVFKTIYHSIVKNQEYIKNVELIPDCNIKTARHCFENACDLIDKHINTNSNIVIFDTFMKSEDHFAQLYSLLHGILQNYFFATDFNYYIFLLKFDDEKQILNWSQENTLVSADYLPIKREKYQILSYNYTIKDLNPENLKSYNKKFPIVQQIYEYKHLAVSLLLNTASNIRKYGLTKKIMHAKYVKNCLLNINYAKCDFEKINQKYNYFEFRNQKIMEIPNKSFDFTIYTLVKPDEEKQTSYKNKNFVAIASLYSNIFNKKKLICRFIYRFTKQDDQYFMENTSYNKVINHSNNFTYVSCRDFIQTLQDFLEKQYFFDDCDVLDLKYFVVKNVYTPAYKKVLVFSMYHGLSLENTVKRFLENLNSLQFNNIQIKFYHATFSINLYLQQESLGSQSILKLLHVTHQLHDLDTTSEIFYTYKTIIFDIYFSFNNEIKQFALLIPIQEQRLIDCIDIDTFCKILSDLVEQNSKDVKNYFPEHYNYLCSVFEHIMMKEHVFNAVRFSSLGIQRSIYKKYFIDYIMCKLLKKDQYFEENILNSYNLKFMNWFGSKVDFRSFKYNNTFNKILNNMKNNDKYKKLKIYVIKRLKILYELYTQKILDIKTDSSNYYYVHDKNIIKDEKLHLYITNVIMT